MCTPELKRYFMQLRLVRNMHNTTQQRTREQVEQQIANWLCQNNQPGIWWMKQAGKAIKNGEYQAGKPLHLKIC